MRYGIVLLALLGFAGLWMVSPAYANLPADVPAGHWAADAVARAIESGMMGTLDEGAFRGDDAVNRYELAVILDRLDQARGRAGDPLDEADLRVMRELTDEFRADLVAYYQSRETLMSQLRLTHRTMATFDDTVNAVLSRLDRLQAEQKRREEQWNETLAQMASALDDLLAENERLAQRVTTLEERLSEEGMDLTDQSSDLTEDRAGPTGESTDLESTGPSEENAGFIDERTDNTDEHQTE